MKTEGKILVNPGWQKLYLDLSNIKKDNLIEIDKNEKILCNEITIEDQTTKPPPHYNEATLLSSMETAGKLVEDDIQREAMVEKGIGTPATRAGIIEELIKDKYLIREGRDLLISPSSLRLMQLLEGLRIKELSRADLTGEWEFRLKEIENGIIDKDVFLKDIRLMVSEIVEKTKSYDSITIPGDYATLNALCPKCNGTVKENYKRYGCLACDFSISKTPGGRCLSVTEAEIFIKEKKLGPLEGFRNKWGGLFVGTIIMTTDYKLKFDFDTGDSEEFNTLFYDKSAVIGKCPKCSSDVVIYKSSYTCAKTVGKDKSCTFKTGLAVLQQPISIEQMVKLLTNRKTDLLEGFISFRTRRKFKAFLVLKEDGSVGFEFVAKQKKSKHQG